MAQVEDPANLDQWDSPAHRLITLILIRCGLRVSDACQLPSDCVVRDGDGQPYLRYYNHKMKREALVPIDDELAAEIGASASEPPDAGPAAPPCCSPGRGGTSAAQPIGSGAYRKGLRRWLERCDIRDDSGRRSGSPRTSSATRWGPRSSTATSPSTSSRRSSTTTPRK